MAMSDYATTNDVMTSSNGVNWAGYTSATPDASSDWYSCAYGDGVFVAVSDDGTNKLMTSPDGVTWTAQTPAVTSGLDWVTFGNGLFVAISYEGAAPNQVMTSGSLTPATTTTTTTTTAPTLAAASLAATGSNLSGLIGLAVAIAGLGGLILTGMQRRRQRA